MLGLLTWYDPECFLVYGGKVCFFHVVYNSSRRKHRSEKLGELIDAALYTFYFYDHLRPSVLHKSGQLESRSTSIDSWTKTDSLDDTPENVPFSNSVFLGRNSQHSATLILLKFYDDSHFIQLKSACSSRRNAVSA